MASPVANTFLAPRGPDQPDPGEMLNFDRAMNRQLSDYLQQIVTKLNATDLTDGGDIVGNLTLTGDLTQTGDFDLTGNLDITGDATFSGTLTGPMLRLTSTTDASLASTGHAFQIGPSNAANIIADSNEIMARNNGATSTLFLNNDGGNVSLGATSVLTLQGGQVSFPSTQNASADPNTLDDYEEGTFTPTMSGTTTAGTGTYSVQTGLYTKIGNLVHVAARCTWSAHTGTGNLQMSDLPFAVSTLAVPVTILTNGIAYTGMLQAFAAGTNIPLQQVSEAGARTAIAMDTAGDLIVSVTYRT